MRWEWHGPELAFWPSGFGIVDNIRAEGGRIWFSFRRPGSLSEDLWLAPVHFDNRLRPGDWAKIEDFGEGPPEPDWLHSEIRRVVPPTDEPISSTLHIQESRYGTNLTLWGNNGEVFVQLRDSHGGCQPPPDYRTTTILEMLYSAWRVALLTLPPISDASP